MRPDRGIDGLVLVGVLCPLAIGVVVLLGVLLGVHAWGRRGARGRRR